MLTLWHNQFITSLLRSSLRAIVALQSILTELGRTDLDSHQSIYYECTSVPNPGNHPS